MLNVLDRCETLNLNLHVELILPVEIASFYIWILFRFFSVLNLIKLFLFNHIKTLDLKKAIRNMCLVFRHMHILVGFFFLNTYLACIKHIFSIEHTRINCHKMNDVNVSKVRSIMVKHCCNLNQEKH